MQIEALIERLEKLDGPDRDADWRIEKVIVRPEAFPDIEMWPPFGPGCKFDKSIPRYTASLDATIALAEKVLPGWYWCVGRASLFPNGWAYISRTHPSHCDREDEAACADGKAANPAIALLLTLLRALQSGGRS